MESVVPGPQDRLLDGSYDGPVAVKGPLRRLLLWLTPAYLGMFSVWAGTGILLSLQVEYLNPSQKVANLAIVTTIGALAAMLTQPIAGLVSDRTHSMLGRRAPWMIGGSLAGGLAMLALSIQTTMAGITIAWVAVCISYNCALAPLSAILPDRIPHLARGRFSAMSGLGIVLGLLIGQFLSANLADKIPLAYTILAAACIAGMLGFVWFNPDRPSTHLVREPFSPATLTSMFWVNPIKYPDFFWAFTSRISLNLSYYIVAGTYLLYVLADYIDLGTAQAATTIPLLTLAGAPGGVIATLLSGPISDRLQRRKVFLFTAGFIFAGAMVVPVISPTLTGIMIGYVVGALGFGVFQSVDSVLMSEVLPNDKTFAKDLGIVNMALTLPQTLAPAIAGAIVLVLGYTWLFPAASLFAIIGAVAVIPIKSVR